MAPTQSLVPGLPVTESVVEKEHFTHPFDVVHNTRTYTMYYRHGANANCQKNFEYPGTFREAMARAKEHCSKLSYRFIHLRPFISNLEDDERARENGITI